MPPSALLPGVLTLGALCAWALWRSAAPAAPPPRDERSPARSCAQPCGCCAAASAERRGRVRAERQLRAAANERYGSSPTAAAAGGYPLVSIGSISSPFRGRWGAPRQSMLAPASRAQLRLSSAVPDASLRGLEAYSHVHIIFLFHNNTNAHWERRGGVGASGDAELRGRRFAALIEAPALLGGRTGVFSTRSPHRPNAIGLSLCRLAAVRPAAGGGGAVLELEGCDLIDGTPVVDIKPFAPYDCATCAGTWLRGEAAAAGAAAAAAAAAMPARAFTPRFAPARNLATARARLLAGDDFADATPYALRGPAWVFDSLREQHRARLPVVWRAGTAEAVAEAVAAGRTKFYGGGGGGNAEATATDEAAALALALTQVLALDIRAVHHGRGARASAARGGAPLGGRLGPPPPTVAGVQHYEIFYDTLGVRFAVVDDEVAGADDGGDGGGSGGGGIAPAEGGAAQPARRYHVEVLSVQAMPEEAEAEGETEEGATSADGDDAS